MTEPNHPTTLDRAQEQIAKIARAESYAAVDLLNLWARGYVEALFAEGLIDWDEHGRLNDAIDQQRNQRKVELEPAALPITKAPAAMENVDEWAKLKVRRISDIRTSIDTLRQNAECQLRKYRHGHLHGQIHELRIVGLFTSEEARELTGAASEANRQAYKEEQAAES